MSVTKRGTAPTKNACIGVEMKSFKKKIQKRIITCKEMIFLEKEEETFAASAANARILSMENRIKESVRINDYIKGCASRDAEYEASLWP